MTFLTAMKTISQSNILDWSYIGKEGLIIQFEDLVSFIGWNASEYINNAQGRPVSKTKDERLVEYINRLDYDIPKYVKETTGVDTTMKQLINSKHAIPPNVLYAFRMFKAAVDNGLKNLLIHSNVYSQLLEEYVKSALPYARYVHGDIVPVLKDNPNCTYTTSNPTNIRKCVDVGVPFALTICDDFMYVAPVVTDDKLLNQLKEQNVFVQYTSIMGSGLVR